MMRKNKLDASKYRLPHGDSMGSQCYAGYAGLTYTADQIQKFIPRCDVYCEPLAGLARVAKFVKSEIMILNDKSDYALKYLRYNFLNAVITSDDYLECIKNNDSNNTFFLIDPPYRTSAYTVNSKSFCDRTDTEYFKECKQILPTLKGDFIMCSDSSRSGARIFKDTKYYTKIVESTRTIYGKKSRILLISNLPFIEQPTSKYYLEDFLR